MYRYAILLTVSSMLLSPFARSADSDPSRKPRKKLIEVGWDAPDTEWLRQNLPAIEKTPFNGVKVQIMGRTENGERVWAGPGFINRKWDSHWFATCVEDLKIAASGRLTDNFISFSANPGWIGLTTLVGRMSWTISESSREWPERGMQGHRF